MFSRVYKIHKCFFSDKDKDMVFNKELSPWDLKCDCGKSYCDYIANQGFDGIKTKNSIIDTRIRFN